MPESAAYARRTHKGGARLARIPGGLSAGVTGVVAADDLSSWSGATADGPTRVMVNREGATPEEIEISAVSGNNITISARGLEGTSDTTHDANATIEIVSSPRDFDEANYAVAETVGKVTAAGDLLVSDGANSLKRLGKGTAGQYLRTNSGATDLEWGGIVTDVESVNTSETTTSTSYTDLATVHAQGIVVGPSGAVMVTITAEMSNSGAANATRMSVASSDGVLTASDTRSLLVTGTAAQRGSMTLISTGHTPGATVTFTAKYTVSAGTGTFIRRRIDLMTW